MVCDNSALNKEAIDSSETMVTAYKSTMDHNTEISLSKLLSVGPVYCSLWLVHFNLCMVAYISSHCNVLSVSYLCYLLRRLLTCSDSTEWYCIPNDQQSIHVNMTVNGLSHDIAFS